MSEQQTVQKESKTEVVDAHQEENGDDDGPKKRGARIQLTADKDPEKGFLEEDPKGTWKKADAETLSQRRIVKVKRGSTTISADKPAPAFNFGMQPVGSAVLDPSSKKDDQSTTETKKEENSSQDKKEESKKTGSIFSTPSTASLLTFGNQTASAETSIFGSQFTFGSADAPLKSEPSVVFAAPGKQEVVLPTDVKVETGEENEEHAFQVIVRLSHHPQQPAKLHFMYKDPETGKTQWKERGKGVAKINISKENSKKARLVMRVNQSLRVILNTPIFSSLHFDKASDKSVRFVAPDVDPPHLPISLLLQFAKTDILTEFMSTASKYTEIAPTETASVIAPKPEKEEEEKTTTSTANDNDSADDDE